MSAATGWRTALRSRAWRPFAHGRRGDDASTAGVGAAPLLDESDLARLRRVTLSAGRARTEGLAGEHRSRRRGSSPEFADFKRYAQGDDFRRIDWNTYARLDSLFVRLSEITTELSVHVLLDSSASMDWRGTDGGVTKFAAGRRLAAALAYIALWGFDRLTIAPFAEHVGGSLGPVQGRAQVVPALRYLEGLRPMGGTALAPAIAAYTRARTRPGLVLIVSDLLSGEPEALQETLHALRGRGWQSAVLHVVDEAEVDAGAAASWLRESVDGSNAASLELVDRESGLTLRLAPDDEVATRYAAAVAAWIDRIEAACVAESVAYARIPTGLGIDQPLLALLHEGGILT